MTQPHFPGGRCWVLGDDINTDYLAPGPYMKFGIDVIAQHCLKDVDPCFASQVRAGDLVIAGSNFGAGSSREQAVEVLRHLGVRCVIAQSFAGLFYRNGFNLGLPLLQGNTQSCGLATGDQAQLDLQSAKLSWGQAGRQSLQCTPIPAHLLQLVQDGGLVPHLHKRLARERAQSPQREQP